jgi:hypothetical protein
MGLDESQLRPGPRLGGDARAGLVNEASRKVDKTGKEGL